MKKKQKQIQLLQLTGNQNKSYLIGGQNAIRLQETEQQLRQSIQRIMGNVSSRRGQKRNKVKIYNLFYIDPLSRITGLWDFFVITIIYIFQLQISLTLGYGPSFWQNKIGNRIYQTLYVSFLAVLSVDIVLNFHKGYYAFGRGKVIDDPKLIIKHYLKIYFAMDIVIFGTLFIPIFRNEYILNFLQLIPAVLLYMKKFKCQNQITGMLQYRKKFRIFFTLFMLAADVLLIGHFGACIFVGIDLLLWRQQYYGDNPQYYWLSNNDMYSINLMDGSWIAQYVYAQSFSTGTLSTIAPGPFPKNPIQILYSNLVMIFFMFLASYVAQIIVSILLTEDQIRTFHEQNIQKFDKFLKLKGVADKISKRIHSFFELIWEKEVKMNIEQEKSVLDKLPLSLKQELIVQLQFIQKIRLFKNFSNSSLLIRLVSLKVQNFIIDSGTTLFKAFTSPDQKTQRCIYYFKEGFGEFNINFGENKLMLALSNVQKTVGQFQFLTGLAYSYSCQSIDLCVISKVTNQNMLQILSANGLMQQYQVLKQRLLIQNKLYLISKTCIVCQGYHIQINCPRLYPALDIRQRGLQKLLLKKQMRKEFKRGVIKSIKKRKIEKTDIARVYIILVFMAFRNANQKNYQYWQRVQKISNFEIYFKQFNLQ